MWQAHPFMKTFTELKLDEKFKEAISKKNQYKANTTFNQRKINGPCSPTGPIYSRMLPLPLPTCCKITNLADLFTC